MREGEHRDRDADEDADDERQNAEQVNSEQREDEEEQLPLVPLGNAPALLQSVDRPGATVDDAAAEAKMFPPPVTPLTLIPEIFSVAVPVL